MNKQILKMIANVTAFFIGVLLFSQVNALNISSIIIAGIVLWIVNIIIRPLLVIITLPVNILTLGFFSLIINTWMIMLVDKFVDGLVINGFWSSFGLAVLVVITNMIFVNSNSKK